MVPTRRGLAALAVLAVSLPPLAPSAASAATAGGVRVVASQRIDARLLELTVRTPALAAATKVRVLLPAGYAAAQHRRYPVLYLLHGASGSYRDWTRSGEVERLTAGKPLIVVMPDGGRGGWYTNWYNGGKAGAPAWETYHVDELIPLVDRRFRTLPVRRGRAIAGLSMGWLRRLQLRRPPPRPVRRRGELLGRRRPRSPALRAARRSDRGRRSLAQALFQRLPPAPPAAARSGLDKAVRP